MDGKIIVEGLSVPEGAVLAPDDDPDVHLPPALANELAEALDEAD